MELRTPILIVLSKALGVKIEFLFGQDLSHEIVFENDFHIRISKKKYDAVVSEKAKLRKENSYLRTIQEKLKVKIMNKKELLAKIESALNNSQTSVIAFQDDDNPQIKEMLIKAQERAEVFEAVLMALKGDSVFLNLYIKK